eukprot:Gregarina_sp_Poly_1__1055@NODE_125_length_13444_cov_91_472378_g111_i0_p14_GENE_NODE_125_length_13444_cov_91_472378_g111_i0NODE_125_length_13444_cov_91_472378_g111_i0_p14_ORF_typecomplete_len119_score5_87MMPL/PF03176_15/0_071_NODE_125_length_13444_cov_91_472378_g111_i01182612182
MEQQGTLQKYWNALKPIFNGRRESDAYVQVPGAGPSKSPEPSQNNEFTLSSVILFSAIGVAVIWLLRSLLPLLITYILYTAAISVIVVSGLVCFHGAQSRNRSQAFEAHPHLHDPYVV